MFPGCNSIYENVTPLEPLTLQDVLAISQERREGIIKPSIEYISQFTQGREERTVNMARFTATRRRPEKITSQEAIDDFTLFSAAVRQVYAGYIFFGGDEVFLPVFDEVKELLASKEYWQVLDFITHIFFALDPVINDNHFWLGMENWAWAFGNRYDFLVPANFNDAFDKSENGFRNRRTGHYVQKLLLDGEPVVFDAFRLSVGEDGTFYYSIVIVHPESYRVPTSLTIIYENGRRDRIFVTPIPTYRRPHDKVSLQHIQGFPVVTLQEMMPFEPDLLIDYCYATKFLRLAEELQDEPIIIIDIRSNRGGYGLLVMRWLHILFGEIVPTNYLTVTHQGFINDVLRTHDERFLDYLAPKPLGENHQLTYTHDKRIISNDQLLIFLTDRFTASAGDAFTDMAFNIENALVIGQNTAGVLQTDGRWFPYILPNSTALFNFGRGLSIHPTGHFYEGRGIAPDIWVNGDVLEATIAMLNANMNYIDKLFR